MQRGDIFVVTFVVARTPSMRPSLQHVSDPYSSPAASLCGRDMSMWSRAYQNEAIEEILCKRCDRVLKRLIEVEGLIVKSPRLHSKDLADVK